MVYPGGWPIPSSGVYYACGSLAVGLCFGLWAVFPVLGLRRNCCCTKLGSERESVPFQAKKINNFAAFCSQWFFVHESMSSTTTCLRAPHFSYLPGPNTLLHGLRRLIDVLMWLIDQEAVQYLVERIDGQRIGSSSVNTGAAHYQQWTRLRVWATGRSQPPKEKKGPGQGKVQQCHVRSRMNASLLCSWWEWCMPCTLAVARVWGLDSNVRTA